MMHNAAILAGLFGTVGIVCLGAMLCLAVALSNLRARYDDPELPAHHHRRGDLPPRVEPPPKSARPWWRYTWENLEP
jgi:hypothetical protein